MKLFKEDTVTGIETSETILDARNAEEFKRTARLLIPGKSRKLLLDIGSLEFVDSAGLGTFLSLMREMRARNGEMVICCPRKSVTVLFQLVRMDKVLKIVDTREEGLEACEETP